MTEQDLRQMAVSTATGWMGAVKGSAAHKHIIDVYNTIKPLPRGVRMSYAMDWCAAFVSAVFQAAGLIDRIPAECSCGLMMMQAQARRIWVEEDGYHPQVGDLVLYDWQDDGRGDNLGAPDHVGIVTAVSHDGFQVVEGNMGNPSRVGTRNLAFNARYIRGFICPDFSTKTEQNNPTETPWYSEAMEWCKDREIMDGTRPLDTLTRAEAATIIKRTVEYIEKTVRRE